MIASSKNRIVVPENPRYGQLEVGGVFMPCETQVFGRLFKVVLREFVPGRGCYGCAFCENSECETLHLPRCSKPSRKDHNSVIFVEV